MNCPACQSAECKKVSMVYQAGTSSGSIIGGGMSLDGSAGLGGGIISKQSLLAERLAPPSEDVGIGAMELIVISITAICAAGAITGFFLDMSKTIILVLSVSAVLGALLIVVLNRMHSREKEDTKDALLKWDRQWVCLACGHIWDPLSKPSHERIKFACPHCDQHLETERSRSGELIDCPTCKATIEIRAA